MYFDINKSNATQEGGYVLITVLVVILVLSLGMGITAETLNSSQLRSAVLQKHRSHDIVALSATEKLKYVLLKDVIVRSRDIFDSNSEVHLRKDKDIFERWVNELQSQYKWNQGLVGEEIYIDGAYVTVLDQAGMIDLNSRDSNLLRLLAGALGAKRPQDFVDTLLDFRDEDDFIRLKGGEVEDYTDVKVLNTPLQSFTDVCRVIGWRDLEICKSQSNLAHFFYVGEGRAFRFRLASDGLQKILLGSEYSEQYFDNTLSWANLASSMGIYGDGALGGSASREYSLLVRSDPDLGLIKREDFRLRGASFHQPIEISSFWQGGFDEAVEYK